jgi:hypothetical protein
MGIFVGIILIIVWVLFEFLLQKTFRGKEKVTDTSGERTYRLGRIIIGIIFLVIFLFVFQTPNLLKWALILFIITLLGFKAIMELKFLTKSKDYIATIISLIIGVVVLYNLDYLLNMW